MSQKWNLQDIRPAEPKRRRPQPRTEPTSSNNEAASDTTRVPVTDGRKRSRRLFILPLAIIAILAIGTISISSLMSGAEIMVYPKHRVPTVNASFTAYPEPRTNELSFEIMTLVATDETQVTAVGEEEVSERATGQIEIVKSTPGTQQLVVNTRFESPDGLIYRTTEGVEVPGAVSDGDGMSPGTVRVRVVADDSGEAYNVSSGTRFTIPGFAEGGFTELFDAMYAEARTEIDGGFDGVRYAIGDEERSRSRQELQLQLRDQLLEQMHAERPADFVLFSDAVTFTYEMLPPVEYGGDLVTLKEEVTLRVPLFNVHDFSTYIAAASVPTYSNEPVRIDNMDTFRFQYENTSTRNEDISLLESLQFTLVGDPHIVWTFDETEFKQELAGEQKDALRFIVDEFAAIERAEARIQPFWQQTYPTDLDLMTVVEIIE